MRRPVCGGSGLAPVEYLVPAMLSEAPDHRAANIRLTEAGWDAAVAAVRGHVVNVPPARHRRTLPQPGARPREIAEATVTRIGSGGALTVCAATRAAAS